jgi:hypothetical protein
VRHERVKLIVICASSVCHLCCVGKLRLWVEDCRDSVKVFYCSGMLMLMRTTFTEEYHKRVVV